MFFRLKNGTVFIYTRAAYNTVFQSGTFSFHWLPFIRMQMQETGIASLSEKVFHFAAFKFKFGEIWKNVYHVKMCDQ